VKKAVLKKGKEIPVLVDIKRIAIAMGGNSDNMEDLDGLFDEINNIITNDKKSEEKKSERINEITVNDKKSEMKSEMKSERKSEKKSEKNSKILSTSSLFVQVFINN
jgi:hypothetical protein